MRQEGGGVARYFFEQQPLQDEELWDFFQRAPASLGSSWFIPLVKSRIYAFLYFFLRRHVRQIFKTAKITTFSKNIQKGLPLSYEIG